LEVGYDKSDGKGGKGKKKRRECREVKILGKSEKEKGRKERLKNLVDLLLEAEGRRERNPGGEGTGTRPVPSWTVWSQGNVGGLTKRTLSVPRSLKTQREDKQSTLG